MSAAVRCLAIVIVGWAGARAASVGVLPTGDLFSLKRSEARAAPAAAFPALEPSVPLDVSWPVATPLHHQPQSVPPPQLQLIRVPYYVPVHSGKGYSAPRQSIPTYPTLFPAVPRLEDWPVSRFSAPVLPAATIAAVPVATTVQALAPAAAKFDRVQLTAWALLRGREGIGQSPQSLAGGGTLGGSQAGARLTYRFSPQIAASLRTTSAVGTSQSEVAAGVRLTPLPSIPVSLTAERRQALGDYGGRSAFALFAEAGLYGESLLGFDLDGYGQGGLVGLRERALFADGALAFTRPVYRQVSAGFGVWAGAQPALYRLDAGPRLSYRVRPNVKVHLDWRQRLVGSAAPGSGPAVTLAGDF
jgi:hypothetical protein